jgi:hypothetical protein
LMAASATFALKAGVWFRRGRLLIISPDSLGTACPLSGRNSTYRPVRILEAGSHMNLRVRPALKAKLEKLAKEDRRTLSAYVEKLLEDHVDQLNVERERRRVKQA